ncbi:MAG: transposase [Thaumarchaeota archaeon]|nr:transposase [Nitrososphaerota archaeon]
MPTALHFRLYPSKKQEARLSRTLTVCRHLWNDALAHRRQRWQVEGKSTSYNYQQAVLTGERHVNKELLGVYSQVAQDVLHRLDLAFKAFFKHQSRYPRFKKPTQSGSFTYPQAYNRSVKPNVPKRRLYLSKIGNVTAIFHRPIPKDSRLKTCTVVRTPDGRWYASLVFEEIVPLQNLGSAISSQQPKTPIGVDLGLLSLIATSNGQTVEHPRFLRKAEERLKHLQRNLSHRNCGSKNRLKARRRVASQHSKVRRQRLDFNHKISTNLIRKHDFIAFEDLRIKNMVKNHRLAMSIHDAGWGQLVRLTEYKALKAGSRVVRVPAAYSTQECYNCEAFNKIDLGVREFLCIGCGRHLNRDHNAANVVLKRGLAIACLTAINVGQDLSEFKPVETRPMLLQTTGEASQVEETGTTRPHGLKAHDLELWEDVTGWPGPSASPRPGR